MSGSVNSLPSAAIPPQTCSSSDNDSAFVCSICLDGVKDKDPVLTQCGHLYCWPCLYRWLNSRNGDGTCPVCKAGVTQQNVIPIFIKGSTEDPRLKNNSDLNENIPNRPIGHRPEPMHSLTTDPNNVPFTVNYNAQLGGISFSAGFGFFPSLFGLQFQSFAPSTISPHDEQQQTYLSRILLFLGVCVVLCLLLF